MTILHIDSSINGNTSASREVSGSIVNQLKGALWGEEVVYRDLAANPLPHLTLEAFADTRTLDEFMAADTIVIGAPMYNFTVPSQLKAWIDRIVIAGATFRYTENGPEGLAKGKRVIIAIARGGIYSEGSPTAAFEHVETYLRGVFNMIGIEPEFVVAEGVNLSPEHRVAAIENALGETIRLAA
ncbi:FMN-dependent NADH-azoreductase [Sphingomonas sp. URHD0057]|uniref:FMN-dependent NADH-azoreductase n=1 Tax=Sphingomonas sp. URHD0057 TaxID=1380389 RepID=UPI00048C6EAE|nr:NAD(P)H-dependent oxidoreductase [Sphingomonas sp. URHD0057]